MGYKGLNYYLDSNLYKPGGKINKAAWHETKNVQKDLKIVDISNNYYNKIIKNLHEDLYNSNETHLYQPISNLKYIKPVQSFK